MKSEIYGSIVSEFFFKTELQIIARFSEIEIFKRKGKFFPCVVVDREKIANDCFKLSVYESLP